jgi:hypothetical protein
LSDLRISGASASARTESDIRLNYGDPSKVIAAANDFNSNVEAVFFSTDGGTNWSPSSTNLPLAAGDVGQSDPAVDWTSDGTAWALCIGFDTGQLNLRVRCYKSTDNGANWALDSTVSGAQGTPMTFLPLALLPLQKNSLLNVDVEFYGHVASE